MFYRHFGPQANAEGSLAIDPAGGGAMDTGHLLANVLMVAEPQADSLRALHLNGGTLAWVRARVAWRCRCRRGPCQLSHIIDNGIRPAHRGGPPMSALGVNHVDPALPQHVRLGGKLEVLPRC